MHGTKAFWKSRGFWGPVVAFLSFLLQQAGVGALDESTLVDALLVVGEAGGMLVGLIGRAGATARLALKDKPPAPPAEPSAKPSAKAGAETAARLQAAWPATLLAAGLAMLLLAGCAASEGETPAQRLYGLKADYETALVLAVAYKRDCEARAAPLKGGCAAHVAELRRIDLELIQPALARAQTAAVLGDDPALAAATATLAGAVAEFTAYIVANKLGRVDARAPPGRVPYPILAAARGG